MNKKGMLDIFIGFIVMVLVGLFILIMMIPLIDSAREERLNDATTDGQRLMLYIMKPAIFLLFFIAIGFAFFMRFSISAGGGV